MAKAAQANEQLVDDVAWLCANRDRLPELLRRLPVEALRDLRRGLRALVAEAPEPGA
ncbi:MAG TPA: hypothetical protein VFC93_07430 [Chloroflexota bacterium]|nr:hypothetical protein [Chloroflexota bacterium]